MLIILFPIHSHLGQYDGSLGLNKTFTSMTFLEVLDEACCCGLDVNIAVALSVPHVLCMTMTSVKRYVAAGDETEHAKKSYLGRRTRASIDGDNACNVGESPARRTTGFDVLISVDPSEFWAWLTLCC
eukprot:SAG31_NODE_4299_length_3373_cov_1.830483_2_plen_128_part_00